MTSSVQDLSLLLQQVKNHSLTPQVIESTQKKTTKLSSEEILLVFIQNQLSTSQIKKQITNFDEDFKDCSIFSSFFHNLTKNEKFLTLLELDSNLERAKFLMDLLKEFDFSFPICQPKEIANGNKEEILSLIANVYLTYYNELETKKKMELKSEDLKKQINSREQEIEGLEKMYSNLSESLNKEELSKVFKTGSVFDFTDVTENLFQLIPDLNQNIIDTFKVLSEILDTPDENSQKFLQELINVTSQQNEQVRIWNLKTIFHQSLVVLIKSHQKELFTEKLHTLLKLKIEKMSSLNGEEFIEFYSKLLDLLKQHKIWSMQINPIYKSITTLFDQFLFFINYQTELTNSLISTLLTGGLFNKESNQEKIKKLLYEKLFLLIGESLPGIVSDNLLIDIFTDFFFELGISEKLNVELIISEARKRAFGETLVLLIKKQLSENSKEKLVNFLKNNELINKEKEIFEKCYQLLSNYLNKESSDFLCKTFDAKISKESAKRLSFTLFHFFDFFGLSLPLIQASIRYEIWKSKNDFSVLFTPGDISSHFTGLHCLLYGEKYLKSTLAKIIQQVANCGLNFNIPIIPISGNINEMTNEERNSFKAIENVRSFYSKFVDAIFDPQQTFPIELKIVASFYKTELPQSLKNYLPQTLARFIITRFIFPAIVSPENFSLVKNKVPGTARRGLMNISSVIKNLANGTIFPESKKHMLPLNEDITKKIPDRDRFYERISNPKLEELRQFYKPYSAKNQAPQNEPITAIHVRKLTTKLNWDQIILPSKITLKLLANIQRLGGIDYQKIKTFRKQNNLQENVQLDQNNHFFGLFGASYLESTNKSINTFINSLLQLNTKLRPVRTISQFKEGELKRKSERRKKGLVWKK
ncbi:ras gtpase-activating protein [Anaeramoeba flamelloides]|uniref:Ras gtpase-activating protein n=1 Tax=Anaeramoeba flamelloides TaxID=1746091 RepID=A0AAV7Y847_9EUKA|nr:ras gtpase-activating protein [Anaeramoeba flamelloides]